MKNKGKNLIGENNTSPPSICPKSADGKSKHLPGDAYRAHGYDAEAEKGVVVHVWCIKCDARGAALIKAENVQW